MKKQLLIAAVAATMTSVAMADIAISGAVKMNSNDGAYSHEADMTISGKSGDTSVTFALSLDNKGSAQDAGTDATIAVEDAYVTTSVAGVTVKMGGWRSGKSELGGTSDISERVNVSTTFGGLALAYEDNGSNNSTTIGGSLAGVSVSHKVNSQDSKGTETKASGSIGGVSVKIHSKEISSKTSTSTTLSTEVQGVTLTYANTTADANQAQDGYIGSTLILAGKTASAIGLSTAIAGNTVQFKSITINDADSSKVIVTRALGAGATFEATYTDTATSDSLDLELAVKF
jgi:hypothetical protein